MLAGPAIVRGLRAVSDFEYEFQLANMNRSRKRPTPDGAIARELADDRRAYALAWRSIRTDPEMFAYASVARVARLWGILPHARFEVERTGLRAARYLVAIWYVSLFVLAAIGATVLRGDLVRPGWLWGVLLCLTFTVVHAGYWSDLRMRAPLTAVLCLLAAVGIGAALHRTTALKH